MIIYLFQFYFKILLANNKFSGKITNYELENDIAYVEDKKININIVCIFITQNLFKENLNPANSKIMHMSGGKNIYIFSPCINLNCTEKYILYIIDTSINNSEINFYSTFFVPSKIDKYWISEELFIFTILNSSEIYYIKNSDLKLNELNFNKKNFDVIFDFSDDYFFILSQKNEVNSINISYMNTA